MADAPFIVERLNAPPFNMKLLSHRFADLKGLDLLQKVRSVRLACVIAAGAPR